MAVPFTFLNLFVGSLFSCLHSQCLDRFSPNLSLLTAFPFVGAGDPFPQARVPAKAVPAQRCLHLAASPRVRGAAGRRDGATDPQCWERAAGHFRSLSHSAFITVGWKLRSGSFSLSGKGVRGFCTTQGSSGRNNAFGCNFISFTLFYHCFFPVFLASPLQLQRADRQQGCEEGQDCPLLQQCALIIAYSDYELQPKFVCIVFGLVEHYLCWKLEWPSFQNIYSILIVQHWGSSNRNQVENFEK